MAARRNRRNRPLRTIESLECRRLFALDVCTSLPLPILDSPYEVAGHVENILAVEDAGAGVFVPGNKATDMLVPLEHFPNDSLFGKRFGYGRLDDDRLDSSRDQLNGGGAAPNLRVTSTQILRDADGKLVDSVPIGQMVAIQVNFATEGIPAGTTFKIRLLMDGVPIDNTVNWATGNGNWFLWWSGWYAAPGQRQLDAVLDVDNQVAETNETDNTQQQLFTPFQATDLPQKMMFPISGVRNQDYAINNYADIDPRNGSARDYRGGVFQYDGHNAWDVGPVNFAGQDQGLPIVAAADGIVSSVADGNFDRKTDFTNTAANSVIVDHGNGWRTIYWHLARDSVTVRVGQSVKAGDVLGEMGSSGISTGTHIHFTLYRYDFPVESIYDPTTYYLPHVDTTYQPETKTGLLGSNISNDNTPSASDWRESFPTKRVFTRSANDPVVLNYALSHMRQGEKLDLTIFRPDGTISADWDWVANQLYRFPQFYWWVGTSYWHQQVGEWRWQIAKDGEVLVSEKFVVTDGVSPGQILVVDSRNANVNPGRTTPFDFGTTIGSQSIFSIRNHGDSPLLLSNYSLPLGFEFVGVLPSSIPAGGSANLTVRFANAFSKKSFGSVRFNTSDPEIPTFVFNVEGSTTAEPTGATLDFPGPDVAYQIGAAPQLLDLNAVYVPASGSPPRIPEQIKVTLHGLVQTGDSLQILHQGFGAGQVGVEGNIVYFGGTVVGTILDSTPSHNLDVLLNSSITTAATNAILRRIAFSSSSDVAVPRFLRAMVLDTAGQHSTHAYKGLRVHEPILTLATVENIRINDGNAQRSRVESLQVKFSNKVDLNNASFELQKLGPEGGIVPVDLSTQIVFGKTVATLTFSGPLTQFGSLTDGNYSLRIVSSAALDTNGNDLDGDQNGTEGGDRLFGDSATDKFFRLFGDIDGDRLVSISEFNQFRSAFGRSSGQSGFQPYFDFDGNGIIGVSDFNALRSRIGRRV